MPVYRSTFNRENIHYEVRYKDVLDDRHEAVKKAKGTTFKAPHSKVQKKPKFGGFQSAASFAKTNPAAPPSSLPSLSGSVQDLVDFVKSQHASSTGSGVVYVHKRKDCALLAATITSYAKVEAVAYHAGLKNEERQQAQEKWMKGTVKVAVATVAFGMGIDLDCVRYVVHWNLAKTVEGFYQER